MVFKLELFKKLVKREVQDFKGWTEVRLRMNSDDVIINLELIKIK